MSWRDEFMVDFAKFLGLPEGARLTSFEEESSYTEGCDTCGWNSGITYTISYWGYHADGKPLYGYKDGGLAEFSQEVNND